MSKLLGHMDADEFENLIDTFIERRSGEDDPPVPRKKRTDALSLSSTHLKFRWSGDLSFEIRYLFRANRSSLDIQDYRDHIIFVGPKYRF